MIKLNPDLRPADLHKNINLLWEASAGKVLAVAVDDSSGHTPPLFTVQGRYVAREGSGAAAGFIYGSAILQYDAFWDESFLHLGRARTAQRMPHYLTRLGADDHGSNIVCTYGHLWRLINEGRFKSGDAERHYLELALKTSGAIQASRWTYTSSGEGFIHSAHGPHSLQIGSIGSLRSLALAHRLGQALAGEHEERISLLRRLIEHARTIAKWNVYYGGGRDHYDVRGRVAQESVFNVADGSYRGPAAQQGYSPYTTWTRGLAMCLLGFAELLEFTASLSSDELGKAGGRDPIESVLLNAASATADFYLANSPADGIPYWDTEAPGLQRMGDHLDRPADPFNGIEPVDSSAAAIAAQGLLRLAHWMRTHQQQTEAIRYWQAGLTISAALLQEPYLSLGADHQGLLLHAVHHRPSGWDHVPAGSHIPHGESTACGDYHLRELALYLLRVCEEKPYLTLWASSAPVAEKK